MRTLLRGGQILDGAGAPAYRGDVRLNGDKIEAVGALSPLPDEQVIDVSGCVVCPAFVDMHRHMDAHPLLGDDMAVELRQGIATTAVGNCGFSLAPYGGAFAAEKRENDAPILGRYPESFRFQFPEYLNALESSASGLNLTALIGLGAVRISLTGFSDAPLSSSALNAARGMLQDALDAGAAGISAGIMYLPEYYTARDEYRAMLAPLRGTGKPLVTHIRGEGDGLVASVREVIEIAREAECPLEISHFKSCGKQNWRKEIFRAIDEIEADEDEIVLYGEFEEFANIQKYLESNGFEIVSAEFERIPHELKEVTAEQRVTIDKLLEKLEEDEDVTQVFHNMQEDEEE